MKAVNGFLMTETDDLEFDVHVCVYIRMLFGHVFRTLSWQL